MKLVLLLLIATCSFLSIFVEGHGYLKSPRSRNWYSNPNSGTHEYGNPKLWDYCPHCLNLKEAQSVCAYGAQDYDNWVDSSDNPMPWTYQAVYTEGQEIEIETVLSANHAGHIDMFVCPLGEDSTIECFLSNPLQFVRNVNDPEGPYDEFYPSRAYVSGAVDHKFIYKLPMGIHGEKVMLHWRYVTANSCIPPGYRREELNLGEGGLNWMRSPGMNDCAWPPNQTGARDTTNPEQFWNCADIKILPASPTKSPAPTAEPVPTPLVTKAPVPAPAPTPTWGTDAPAPGPPPSPQTGCCTWDGGLTCPSTWCNENKSQCEGNCAGTYCKCSDFLNSKTCLKQKLKYFLVSTVSGPTPPTPTPPTPTPPTPTPPSSTPGVATTTRYCKYNYFSCHNIS